MNWLDYQEKLESGEIPIHAHGHQGTYLIPREIAMQVLLAAVHAQRIPFPVTIKGRKYAGCYVCGKAPEVICYEDRVEVEDNHSEQEPFTVEIEFQSGDMVFNDTFPQEVFTKSEADIGTIPGRAKVGEDMAEQGLMHFFVGNSCPDVWREGDTIFFGSLPEDEQKGPKRVGSICTDLWWASFVDSVILTRRAINVQGLENPESDPKAEIAHMRKKGGSVQVKPGTYRCTSYYHLGGMDYGEDERQIYGKLELIPSRPLIWP